MEYIDILNKIEEYNKIIVYRHKNPDLDAYGSQNGLYEFIKLNYPEKEVYMVGDTNKMNYFRSVDEIEDEVFKDSLVFVLDVSVKGLIYDERYNLAKEIIVIDHHKNDTDIENAKTLRVYYSSCAEIITDIIMNSGKSVSKEGALALYAGMVSDTGRFFYPGVSSVTFKLASYLMEYGINIQEIYDKMYVETIESKKLKGHFILNFELTENNVAYMMNKKELALKYNVSTFTVSRGMVNQMAGIEGVNIWVNFTENPEDGNILCEIRSKGIVVVDIAKKYGGGGHDYACGCSIESFEKAYEVLNDLNERAGM